MEKKNYVQLKKKNRKNYIQIIKKKTTVLLNKIKNY